MRVLGERVEAIAAVVAMKVDAYKCLYFCNSMSATLIRMCTLIDVCLLFSNQLLSISISQLPSYMPSMNFSIFFAFIGFEHVNMKCILCSTISYTSYRIMELLSFIQLLVRLVGQEGIIMTSL